MITAATTPCYVSLNRLAKLTGHSRVTLLLRFKDGKLTADAFLDIGGGKSLPLFRPNQLGDAGSAKRTSGHHPLL